MKVDYAKYADGLVPAIVQDDHTGKVLMLGFMNKEALQKTIDTGKVTFYSRTKMRLWTKGEESGNFLDLKSITPDCDNDTLLVKAAPVGPVCHTGADTCFSEKNKSIDFLYHLEEVIAGRQQNPAEGSYVSGLFKKGINAVAQKVGEEAVELVIEAKDNDEDKFLGEAADLLFHYLILLKAKGYGISHVAQVLEKRHK
ncbi:MAG: bifunctional phosphoribosyl-AMP cyclohydrolase/phosphoribosyl-ATP diphosphatase HisIE [Chitinophagaceae bacterium]|nr:bifunctional phosphoribosyl-AMP cyclohydrolase/phosphoribosyl-ATP diphosphatase HisIE [Chitinophagaceae bacterium]